MSEALQQAERVGFLLLKRQTRSASNAWWGRCKAARHPFVEVTVASARARVKVDLYTVSHDFTISGLAEMEVLVRTYVAWGKGPRYNHGWLSRDTASFPVLPHDALEVGGHLLRIANDSISRCESGEATCLRHIHLMEVDR